MTLVSSSFLFSFLSFFLVMIHLPSTSYFTLTLVGSLKSIPGSFCLMRLLRGYLQC
ncbi:hypothetical protein BT93_D0070 [Corymbia citriodora subsp. variegata]|nr:hypothetical protein BT93_D0070 [Corymbia citriodora subsp. variegata]